MTKVLFTHIPKTAGTSMKERVFQRWMRKHGVHTTSYRGYLHLLRRQPRVRFLEGHFAYGVHHLDLKRTASNVRYFVMLRDPVDRAVSHYHFIRTCNSAWYTHPRLDEVRNNDLVSFYCTPARQNLMTKYVAGVPWEYIGRCVSLDGWWGKRCLRRAKSNLLNRYEAFGLKERFGRSARLFASCLEVKVGETDSRAKKTADRPSVEALDDRTVRALRDRNALDLELYQFATNYFENQFTGATREQTNAT